MEIPTQEWNAFVIGGRKKMTPGWTELVRKYFSSFNPYCVINFKHNHLNEKSKKGAYFLAKAKCSHPQCMQFEFRASNGPKLDSFLVIHVR